MKPGKRRVGCIVQAHHRLPESPHDKEPIDWDSPEGLERLKKWDEEHDKARIVTIDISESKAREIVKRLWPNMGLLGATCGQGFSIDNAEQAAVVNEVLKPTVSIHFNLEKHEWTLQTWPE